MALGDVEGDIWTQGEGLEVVKYGTWRRKVWDTRGPFLESPGNFSGPKSNIQIEI